MSGNILIPYTGNSIQVTVKELKQKENGNRIPKTQADIAKRKADKIVRHLTRANALFIELKADDKFEQRLAFHNNIINLIKMI